jgi:tetratricopeptide (TPR) repeat protein
MQCRRWLAPVVASLLLSGAHAQLRNGGTSPVNVGDVHVHVVLSNARNAGPYLMIRLMEGSTSTVISTTYTNDIGEGQFNGVPLGSYHVEVSGDGIQTTESGPFEVDNRKMTQSQWVTVRRLEDSGPKPVSAHSAMISATDLNVPGKARKELDKANEEMAMQNWKKALEHLNKAIALAPQYATAYNNLGVLYAKTNDIPHEEEALKKAVSLDEHFAPALVNYGKLCMRQKNFPQAEELLQKAVTVDPNDPGTLMLLADAEYMDRHFDAAIASALHAHSLGQDHPSFVHYIAARAYQQENRQSEALAEFKIFLQEEPKGPRADYVRGDMARMQSASHPATAQ